MAPIPITFSLVALDCPDSESLAKFYGSILDWEVDRLHEESDWLQLRSPQGATIAFQNIDDYRPPVWPGSEHPQQAHIDLDVADLDEGEARVLALGARKCETQPGETFRVYLDPAGHPFCLVLAD